MWPAVGKVAWAAKGQKQPMKTNNKSQTLNLNLFELSEEQQTEIMELCGIPTPSRSNEEWIQLLRQRLKRQKQQFAALLDHAAENPDLLEHCAERRREIQNTRERLAGCRAMRSQLN
jgi:hypothetical protein